MYLDNISITGHNNPTVNCSNAGGLKFTYCHNCKIQGIIWQGCGAKNVNDSTVPVIEFYRSINITFQNCTFQHSVGPAVVLLDTSGNVKINQCRFLHSKIYKGHGTAIHFSSPKSHRSNTQLLFRINNSNFSKNEQSQSIIYISQYNNDKKFLFLSNSKFSCNQGVTIYLSNQNLHVVGNVSFDNNTAEYGAGFVASNHSSIIFSKNSVVTFSQNVANHSGGAILLSHFSSVTFEANSVTTFSNNTAKQHCGGSLYQL